MFLWIRLVIAGGDEITLICRAKYAYGIVKTYFEKLEKTDTIDGKKNTACAGICLFHSHSPFSTAYQIAEECCESAKKKSRRSDIQNGLMLMDFQYCFSGVTGDLETIRKMTDGSLLGRPYNMGREISQGIPSHGSLEEMAKTGLYTEPFTLPIEVLILDDLLNRDFFLDLSPYLLRY